MHNNYYFLRQLSATLKTALQGTVISECYSQSKDEIILRFETHANSFYIKANLSPSLSILSFPATMERARRNSIDLFPGIIGYRVVDVRQFENERSFALVLEEQKVFLFKMHGNRSNAILLENGVATQLFKNNLPLDAQITLDKLDRSIDWSLDAFTQHVNNPEKLYFTFGKVVWTYLRENEFDDRSIEEKWQMLQDLLKVLEKPRYYLTVLHNTLHLTLLPFENSRRMDVSALDAANEFFYSYTQVFILEKEKANAVSQLRNKINSSQNYYEKNFEKLAEIQNDTNYKHWADLIMANMHTLKQGTEKVALPDFTNPSHLVEIKLKKELSPQSNAGVYYRKAKNQHIEIERLEESLAQKEKEIETTKNEIEAVLAISDLKQLRKKVQQIGLASSSEKHSPAVPFHEFEMNGFRIWVGKNAESNDELTLRYAYKEDLWLHAKDVAGSHVIIKHQAGKKFPKDVIERAAQLAAYNSKRKNETLCPVIVTPRKFVRKRKGDPAGAVVVEREVVILIEPKL